MGRVLDADGTKSKTALVIIWLLFVAAAFLAAARIGTRYAMASSLAWDDWIMVMGLAIYLAQCIASSIAASNGLGTPIVSLSEHEISKFLKADYVSLPLMVLTLALIKWSSSTSIRQLSPNSYHTRADRILRILTGTWLISSAGALFFQCPLPQPWDYRQDGCIDRRAFWTYVGAMNMVTDLAIVILYFIILMHIQISLSKKLLVVGVFSTRILVVAATTGQVATFWALYGDADITKTQWLPLVLNQAVLCMSLITVNLPYLKPFMGSLESGIVRVEVIGSEEELHQSAGAFTLTNVRSYTKSNPEHSAQRSTIDT